MPKVVDHDERRSELAAAAWHIIARDGFDRLTMRNIASEAGYSHSAFARYFPDKDALLHAAFLHTRELADKGIVAATQGERGLTALRHMCLAIMPLGQDGAAHARVALAFWNHAAQNDSFGQSQREHAHAWRSRLLTHLREAEADEELASGIDLTTASDEIAAANMGWQTLRLIMPEFATDARMTAALDSLLSSMRRR